ncbi:hypothetical protein LZC95_19660 [Pendulispora brunnea]|uniref:Uncharacterized protein n=1 Tax=Pendulispora brunnea TaxID=2905690 RepID=A0ABZ2KN56_9BACT
MHSELLDPVTETDLEAFMAEALGKAETARGETLDLVETFGWMGVGQGARGLVIKVGGAEFHVTIQKVP